MRDFRFRAWDKKNRRMIKKSGVQTEDVCLVLNLEGELRDNTFARYRHGIVKKDFVLMQWTGLQDYMGKDIYEGDLVYLAGYGNYLCEFPFIQLYLSSHEGSVGSIKGNLYENPELFEGVK